MKFLRKVRCKKVIVIKENNAHKALTMTKLFTRIKCISNYIMIIIYVIKTGNTQILEEASINACKILISYMHDLLKLR